MVGYAVLSEAVLPSYVVCFCVSVMMTSHVMPVLHAVSQASSIEECCEWAIALRESIALSSSAGGSNSSSISRSGSGMSGRC
jgi:hypothetical protein